MPRQTSQKVEARLEILRQDYSRITGKPFQHFFCPILGVDEPADLIQGHVINRSIKGSPNTWVVQRADVDNFYGSHFESDFELLQYRGHLSPIELLTDKTLTHKFRPTILKNGEPVIFSSQPALPENFVRFELGAGPDPPTIGLKLSKEEAIQAVDERWEFAVFSDARIATLVSLIKAAHLTLFHMLGYRYATSAAGLFVGRDILGNFFTLHKRCTKSEIQHGAWSYFREFTHMVRPVRKGLDGFEGTLKDRKLLFCHATSGHFWAFIVIIKAAGQLHAVLLPVLDAADSVPTFLGFLKNDNERIQLSVGEFDPENSRWNISTERAEQIWPKQGIFYPESAIPPRLPPPGLQWPISNGGASPGSLG